MSKPYRYETPYGNLMQASCKHRTKASQGACGGCFAEMYMREQKLEEQLQEACGLAFDVGHLLEKIHDRDFFHDCAGNCSWCQWARSVIRGVPW